MQSVICSGDGNIQRKMLLKNIFFVHLARQRWINGKDETNKDIKGLLRKIWFEAGQQATECEENMFMEIVWWKTEN